MRMSLLGWAALIWFGAPVVFVFGAIAALIARSRKHLAVGGVAAAPWVLMATPLFSGGKLLLVVLLMAWTFGCIVPLAIRKL